MRILFDFSLITQWNTRESICYWFVIGNKRTRKSRKYKNRSFHSLRRFCALIWNFQSINICHLEFIVQTYVTIKCKKCEMTDHFNARNVWPWNLAHWDQRLLCSRAVQVSNCLMLWLVTHVGHSFFVENWYDAVTYRWHA